MNFVGLAGLRVGITGEGGRGVGRPALFTCPEEGGGEVGRPALFTCP